MCKDNCFSNFDSIRLLESIRELSLHGILNLKTWDSMT